MTETIALGRSGNGVEYTVWNERGKITRSGWIVLDKVAGIVESFLEKRTPGDAEND